MPRSTFASAELLAPHPATSATEATSGGNLRSIAPKSLRPRVRTYVRVRGRGDDPACRRRLLLRVGRAAGRSGSARTAGDRRRRGRSRRELRGEGVRRADGDGWQGGATPLPRRG